MFDRSPVVGGAVRPSALPFALCGLVLAVATGCPPTDVGPPAGATCSEIQPCAEPLVCADGSCVPACTDGSCDRGFCDVNSGRCVECLIDDDCGAARVCNTFTNLCTEPLPGCTSDEDCDGGGVCDTVKGACVQCVESSDCGLGFVCDLLSHTCQEQQGCVTDGDCEGQVCEPNTRVCVQCFAAAHCASGQCDTVSNTCVAACLDADATEPNEGGTAVALVSGGEHNGSICPGDVDEFVFDAAGDVTATVAVDGGRLVVELRDGSGAVLDSGSDGVSATGLAQGSYRIVIRGQDEGVEADYLLRLEIDAPATCTDVDAEDNDGTGTALPLPTDGSLRAGTICGADVDFWRFTANAGDDVTVTVTPGSGAGAVAIEVRNGAGTVLATGDANSPAVVDDTAAGTLFVRVSAVGGDVEYSLRATTSAAPPQCVQSDAEPNDLASQAFPLVTGQRVDGQICANDTDQWRFNANALDDARIVISGSNVRVRVFDQVGAVVGEGTSTFTIADLDAGAFRVEVKGALSTTEAAYTLTVELTPEPAPDPCTEGGLEPDAFSAPRPLSTDGVASAGRICAGDTDFFRFTVTGSSRLMAISVRFVHADGDIDVRLKDGAGGLVASSSGVSDEELILRELAPGDYVVEVFGFSGAVNTYTASASIVTCTEDDFEQNDSASAAVPISARPITATRCPADDDFFAIRLEAGDALDARLTGADLTMSLVSTTGSLLQGDAADGGGRRLQVSSLPAGRYVIRVTGTGTGAAAYTLTPSVTPSPARCVDDGAEPNNASADAFVLDSTGLADGSYALSTLTMCEGSVNTDFFAIDLPGSRSVRFALAHATTSDLDLEVLEQRGTSGLYRTLARAVSLAGVNDEIEGVTNVGGRVIVRVAEFGTQPAAGLPYTVGIEIGDPPNSACVEDRFDTWTGSDDGTTVRFNNDATTDADNDATTTIGPVPLSPPESLPSLRICPNNSDFFSVSLTQGQRLVVDMTYAHTSNRDLDIRVFGPDDSNTPADPDTQIDRLACDTCDGVTGEEQFDGTAPKTGTYFIEVFGFAGGENVYDLSVTTP